MVGICIHVKRVAEDLFWNPTGDKRKRGRYRLNWIDAMLYREFEDIEMTWWVEVEEAAQDMKIWRSRVARCAAGTGQIKVWDIVFVILYSS